MTNKQGKLICLCGIFAVLGVFIGFGWFFSPRHSPTPEGLEVNISVFPETTSQGETYVYVKVRNLLDMLSLSGLTLIATDLAQDSPFTFSRSQIIYSYPNLILPGEEKTIGAWRLTGSDANLASVSTTVSFNYNLYYQRWEHLGKSAGDSYQLKNHCTVAVQKPQPAVRGSARDHIASMLCFAQYHNRDFAEIITNTRQSQRAEIMTKLVSLDTNRDHTLNISDMLP